jgi:hypothetical protein
VVEVSVDGGDTWRRADGRENWSYTYTATEGTADVRVRAADDSVNLSDEVSHSFEVGERTCPCSLWSDTAPPAEDKNDQEPGGIEVGVRFRAAEDGFITAIRQYVGGDAGTHTANLWTNTGTNLATATSRPTAPAGAR